MSDLMAPRNMDAHLLDMPDAHPVDFIHVGLGKCASTYLQQIWTADEKYNPLNAQGLVQSVRAAAETNPTGRLSVTPPNKSGVQTTVLSSEGFTWGWITGSEEQSGIARLHEVSARVLGEAGLSSQVLLLVRDPVDWLCAAHEQSIKEGGHASLKTFVENKPLFCRSVLDLAAFTDCFSKYFRNVVVLSSDELRQNPDGFWRRYAEALAVPKPSKAALLKVRKAKRGGNKSLGERIPVLAALNRHSAAVSAEYIALKDFPHVFPQEYAGMKPFMTGGWVWTNRRLAEFASDEQLAKAAAHVQPMAAETFREVAVDRELGDWIEDRFLSVLDRLDTIPSDMVTRYRMALHTVLE